MEASPMEKAQQKKDEDGGHISPVLGQRKK